MEIIIYGLINSATFFLIAVGFGLVYGIARIPNFAHGAMYVLAGLLTWFLASSWGIPYPIAIILSLLTIIAVSLLMYLFFLKRVRGMVVSEILITYAFGVIVLEGLRCSGFIGYKFFLKTLFEGTLYISNIPVDLQRIMILVAAAMVVLFIWLFTHRTKLGLTLRAIAQDEGAALLVGIDSDMAALAALALGGVLLGLASILILPLGIIRMEIGYDVLIFSLAVCIVGGLGSLTGIVEASCIFGFAQILTTVYISPHFTMVVVFASLVLVLLIRPSGLKGRQREIEERV